MVSDILSSIPDEVVMGELDTNHFPIRRLYIGYVDIQKTVKLDHELTDSSSGKDLKEAVRALEDQYKSRLLNAYFEDSRVQMGLFAKDTKMFATIGSDAELSRGQALMDARYFSREPDDLSFTQRIARDAQLRRWIVKVVVTAMVVSVLLVLGAAIAIGVMTGGITDGVLVNTVMNTAIEVLKLILAGGVR